MDRERALNRVVSSFAEGAKLGAKVAEDNGRAIVEAGAIIAGCLRDGGTTFWFGNGGSAADAQHMAAELVGRFVKERRPFSAVALTTDSSVLTAVGNDFGFDQVLARQVEALGRPKDVVIAISTSGNSRNVIEGVVVARKKGIKSIGLAGNDGGILAQSVDVPIVVAASNTARIQECHITIGHILCELVEDDLVKG